MASGDASPARKRVTFDWSAAESSSAAVVTAVARDKGVEPTDIEPLYGTVDPDALNTLFAEASSELHGYVQFSYEGYDVVVDADGSGSLLARSSDSTVTTSTSSKPAAEGAK